MSVTITLFAAMLAAIVTASLCVVLRPLFVRYALARPNARSSHKVPTPQGGGIPLLIGAAAGAIAIIAMSPAAAGFGPVVTLLSCAAGLALLGIFDDIRPLEPLPRLVIQAIAAVIIVETLPSTLRVIDAIPFWIERAGLVIGLLWFVNLVNFMDGIDWITVAETVPVTATLGIFGLAGALPETATAIAIALCGATLGFAPFNKPVARLFLGDVGSLPLGLLMGYLLIMLAGDHLVAALLLPLYYLADSTITLMRRLAAGEQVLQAHRSHFYQRAMDNGYSVTGIVARVFALNVALALLAGLTFINSAWIVQAGALACGCGIVGFTLWRFATRHANA